ncbi:MAG: hypothetical protein IJ767_05355 [Bacteroidaceae bacterium]|nr:hypothetical protein [Bacteroidaceae bacterium]
MELGKIYGAFRDSVQGIAGKVKEHTVREIDIKVCMLGARGVGKTSVLTSIFYDGNSKDGFYGTKIRLYATPDTSSELTKKHDLLRDVFKHRENISALGATSGVNEFKLQLGLLSEAPNINLLITDYPGEKVETEKQYVADRIKESEVVIVAIDSPYMMENDDAKDEEKNRTGLIRDFLLENIGNLKEKIILFVPLKCEKYLDLKRDKAEKNDRSGVLADKVERAYKEVIDQLAKQENVAIAITPILTMGGVVFDGFELNSEGGQGARYKFYDGETVDGLRAKYEPLFCSQPIFYLLSFVTRQYKLKRKSADLLGRFFQNFENVDDFFEEMVKIDKRRLIGPQGYRVLAGKDLFFCKNM